MSERTQRLAELAVRHGANVRPGQDVLVVFGAESLELARAVGVEAYRQGARFVDTLLVDTVLTRARIDNVTEDDLSYMPDSIGARFVELGEKLGSRISIQPHLPPGSLAGVDAARAGLDRFPAPAEMGAVINARTTNWTVVPGPTREWAAAVYPDADPEDAYRRLWDEIEFTCRLDEAEPAAAWGERMDALGDVSRRLTERRFDEVHFEGPGTDLRVGLFPSSLWKAARSETLDGHPFQANIPSEEVTSTPDPLRAEGIVTSTKPLEIGGTQVDGLVVRFEGGRVAAIDADRGADVLRVRAATDDGASRLGEVALVDREGRVGQTGTIFRNTLLDENAASHLALGSAYLEMVEDEAEKERANRSAIHIDFMIGSDDVDVTGITRGGERVPVLRGGSWQL